MRLLSLPLSLSLTFFPSLSFLLSSLVCVVLLIESICCLKVFFGTTLICLPAAQICQFPYVPGRFRGVLFLGTAASWSVHFVPRIDKWDVAKVVGRVANSAALSTLLLFVYASRWSIEKSHPAPAHAQSFLGFCPEDKQVAANCGREREKEGESGERERGQDLKSHPNKLWAIFSFHQHCVLVPCCLCFFLSLSLSCCVCLFCALRPLATLLHYWKTCPNILNV